MSIKSAGGWRPDEEVALAAKWVLPTEALVARNLAGFHPPYDSVQPLVLLSAFSPENRAAQQQHANDDQRP